MTEMVLMIRNRFFETELKQEATNRKQKNETRN